MFTSRFKEGHDGFGFHSLKHQCTDQRTTAPCCPLTATLRTATLTGQARNHHRGWKVILWEPYKHKTTLQLAFLYFGQFRAQVKFPTPAVNTRCTMAPGIDRIQSHLSSVQDKFHHLSVHGTTLPAETAHQQRADCIFIRLHTRTSTMQCTDTSLTPVFFSCPQYSNKHCIHLFYHPFPPKISSKS